MFQETPKKKKFRNIYAILKYIADHNIEIYYDIARGYAPSASKFQEAVKAFNERFVMILIQHIERIFDKSWY